SQSLIPLSDHLTSESAYLFPGQITVFSEHGLIVPDSVLHLTFDPFPAFSRNGDTVILMDKNETVLDAVTYTPDFGGNRDGISIERTDPLGVSSDPSNWKEHPDSHSAGYINFHYDENPDPLQPVLALKTGSNKIIIWFNRFVSSESLTRLTFGNQRLTPVDTANGQDGNKFTFQSPAEIEKKYQKITLQSMLDPAGRDYSASTIPLSFIPEKGDLLINEIMYQPLSGRYGAFSDQSQYIEFVNATEVPLLLNGLHIHDEPDKHGQTRSIIPVIPEYSVLNPGDFGVFYPDTSSSFQNSRIFDAFSLHPEDSTRFYRASRLTLGLPVSGAPVYLAHKQTGVLDRVHYSPTWHNRSLIETRGISLERICKNLPTQMENNWSSSSIASGGTPGKENALVVQTTPSDTYTVELVPNPFSPSDGHMAIHYHPPFTDALIRIRIFDRNGRLARNLVDGDRAEPHGRRLWDGRMNDGRLCRQGLYVIYVEFFRPADKKHHSVRTVGVLAY
ncbi:hypothetical protein QLX67_06400, partial [Balneolaceae bacterium ANBcel3]|nr:hypothetical protein [Balneolaceae bacterium ANBcel3]